MVELLLTSLLLPLIVGAIAVAMMSVFMNQNLTANRTSGAADEQMISASYEHDVESAMSMTTSSSATQCGPGTQLLGLAWSYSSSTSSYQTMVSYVEVATSSGNSLVRQYCASGASSTPTRSWMLTSDVPANMSPPTITPSSMNTAAAAGWTSTAGVLGVTFSMTEPKSSYSFQLVAIPSQGAVSGGQTIVATPTTSCGFAAPGTGTYASKICFTDFSGYNPSATPTGCHGNASASAVTAAITNTPYVLSFCLSEAGTGLAVPWPIPTYYNPPTSMAFLGNNGFYTNIPGDPALYQTTQGTTTTVTITNIQLLDLNGNAATGWQLVTGDAESTDSNESITWTSNQNWSLLPNTPTSQIGNACAAPTYQNSSAISLSGLGTTNVTCSATVDSDKTGTVMLEAPAPSTVTVTLVGTGLEALFIGVQLP